MTLDEETHDALGLGDPWAVQLWSSAVQHAEDVVRASARRRFARWKAGASLVPGPTPEQQKATARARWRRNKASKADAMTPEQRREMWRKAKAKTRAA